MQGVAIYMESLFLAPLNNLESLCAGRTSEAGLLDWSNPGQSEKSVKRKIAAISKHTPRRLRQILKWGAPERIINDELRS